jgi:4-diphosphocytidyl-2-C-methyl-D-erythritol kinase
MAEKEQFERIGDGLLVRAPAKLNLSLLIAGKRADGYHNIETVMAKVDWYDELFFEPSSKKGIDLICEGPEWSPKGRENLVYQACKMLMEEAGIKKDVRITLKKNIPAGTGLGSASSDAAAALAGIKNLFGLKVKRGKMGEIAGKLGSDVAFFLGGPLAYCTGRGEKVKKIDKKFDFLAVVVLPDISISTKMIYNIYEQDAGLYKKLHKQAGGFLRDKRIDLAAKMCVNMLEGTCFKAFGGLAELKRRIEELTGWNWCLSGSGSALFCLFEKKQEQQAAGVQRNLRELRCRSIIVRNNRW